MEPWVSTACARRGSPLNIATVSSPPAANFLSLAATLFRRAMIEDTLDGAKSKRYRHAARHLAECRAPATLIGDYGPFEPHEVFVSRLRARHSRKSGFWTLKTDPTTGTASHSDRVQRMLLKARQRPKGR
jgi:hypothetical protein